jgi:glycosyltransferase involved in cell wall biosynthesis
MTPPLYAPSSDPAPGGMRCSAIIATLDRVASLRVVLVCLRRQTQRPTEVLICAAGDTTPVRALAAEVAAPFAVRVIAANAKSAAGQRNQAAALASGDVLAFLDDDIEFGDDLFARMLAHFERLPGPALGAAAARIAGEDRTAPGRLTRWYYRLQAGYAHADYGGRLFGPGINCYPIYAPGSTPLVPSEWLPATCLFVRAEYFAAERFPEFTGYSFAEDVHLTARIARRAPLYFAVDCAIVHHSLPSEFKVDRAALTAGKLRNLRLIARDILGLRGWSLQWRTGLHALFLTVVLILRRPAHWTAELRGIWRSRP